jgi:GTP:adenosylcobinamide-phosphate guanylyltransferase
MIAALVLAGGSIPPAQRAAWGGIANRAVAEIAGQTLLQRVVTALQATPEVGTILVAGDVPLPAGCQAAPGGASLVDTLLLGAAALGAQEQRLLVVTADIPFLTPDAVQEFLAAAPNDAAFVYPIVPADSCRARYPAMRRTTLRIAEGAFTGGNIVLLDPAFLRARDPLLRAAWAQRKSVPGLARLLGGEIVGRLFLSRLVPGVLRIAHLEAAVSRVLGGTARAVVCDRPEIGADIDHPEDIAVARAMLDVAGTVQ